MGSSHCLRAALREVVDHLQERRNRPDHTVGVTDVGLDSEQTWIRCL